jgi:hypothetical protein
VLRRAPPLPVIDISSRRRSPTHRSRENVIVEPLWRRGGPCRGIARHRSKHSATRQLPAGPPGAHAEVLYHRRRRRINDCNMRQRRRGATASDSNSPKVNRREGYLPNCSSPAAAASRRCEQKPGHRNLVSVTHNERRRGQQPGHHDQLITCDAQRGAPRAAAWAQRTSTCDAQRAAPRGTAWVPRPTTLEAPRATALVPRPSACDAQQAATRATA